MQLKSLLNRLQKQPGFVYSKVEFRGVAIQYRH